MTSSKSKTSQERALEFNEKYTKNECFRNELKDLILEYTGKVSPVFKTWPSDVPEYSQVEHKEIEDCITLYLNKNHEEQMYFSDKCEFFLIKHKMNKEWKVPLQLFIFSGYYHVPDKNYYVEMTENISHSASIIVGMHTTNEDIRLALAEAKKQLKPLDAKYRKYAKSYSWIDDYRTIDLLKETSLSFVNEKGLSDNECRLLKRNHTIKQAEKEINTYRKKMKDTGNSKDLLKKVKFKKGLSDKDYYNLFSNKNESNKKIEKLKKQRQNLKKS